MHQFKSLSFSTSSNFKHFLRNINFTLDRIFQYKNEVKTLSSVISSSNRIPSPIIEPVFNTVFKLASDKIGLLNKEQLFIKTESEKQKIFDFLSSDRKVNLCNKRIGRVFEKMKLLLRIKEPFKASYASDVIAFMPGSTSSAFPDFQTPKSNNRTHILEQIHYMMSSCDFSPIYKYLVMIAWRVQQRKTGTKYRIFFPVPHLIQVLEYMFAFNWFKHFEVNKFTPYCFGNVHNDLSLRWKKWQKFQYIYSLDYSSYDLSISNDIIKIVFKFIYINTDFNDMKNFKQLFNVITLFHLFGHLTFSLKNVFHVISKKRGLYSGSSLTNLLGSFINLFLILYFLDENKISLDECDINVMGDDTILCLNKSFKMDELALYFKHTFGIVISIEKSEIFLPGQRVYFLGHYFDDNSRLLDFALAKRQLIISENFIPEHVIPSHLRIWSKFISIVIKCSNGIEFFNLYYRDILKYINCTDFPEYYFNLTQGTEDYMQVKQFNLEVFESWRIQ